jgi:hypothetical protein
MRWNIIKSEKKQKSGFIGQYIFEEKKEGGRINKDREREKFWY